MNTLAILFPALGLLGTFLGYLVRMALKIGALELKVDTMWAFQLRRAASEIVTSNLGTLNSPLRIHDGYLSFLDPVKERLTQRYKESWCKLSLLECLIRIEAEFGDELLSYVCVPCGLNHGACLYLAYFVASGKSELEIHFEYKGSNSSLDTKYGHSKMG